MVEVVDLGIQPLANDFQDESGCHAGHAPLKVMCCPRCSLAQLSVVVDPAILYSNYSYVTSTTDLMKEHFVRLWDDMQRARKISSVLEIGSNTGDFLIHVRDHGAARIIGIDPAKNLGLIARDKMIHTISRVFNESSAIEARNCVDGIDAVVARHVFCHVDNWKEFLANLLLLGDKETIYCIEAPCAQDMIAMNSWDQIYHEHLSYLTIRAMNSAVDDTGLHIHSVQKYPIHGGAIVITLRRDESSVQPDVEAWGDLGAENVTVDTWLELAKRAKEHQTNLRGTIERLLAQGKTVVGFGASAKSTVWINACGLTRKHLRFICDSTPQKQWKFSPGSDIPIVDEGALMRELPDYAVCFAWNFLPEIIDRFQPWIKKGGKFIVPVPEIRFAPA